MLEFNNTFQRDGRRRPYPADRREQRKTQGQPRVSVFEGCGIVPVIGVHNLASSNTMPGSLMKPLREERKDKRS